MAFAPVCTVDSIRGQRLELVEMLEKNRKKMLDTLLNCLANASMPHDVQSILRQYLQEYAEVKESIKSILAQLKKRLIPFETWFSYHRPPMLYEYVHICAN